MYSPAPMTKDRNAVKFKVARKDKGSMLQATAISHRLAMPDPMAIATAMMDRNAQSNINANGPRSAKQVPRRSIDNDRPVADGPVWREDCQPKSDRGSC